MIHIHGFDWAIYTKTIMPAFARWLISADEQEVYELYSGTRHALEEQFVPEAMQPLCAWPRARDFIRQLPRGPFAKREYQKLCVAEQFLLLSDRYVYRHPPKLYRESEALRTIWSASIQHYCLPWHQPAQEVREVPPTEPASNEYPTARTELLDLLQMAGLNKLAEEMNAYLSTREEEKSAPQTPPAEDAEGEHDEHESHESPHDISIAQHPNNDESHESPHSISITQHPNNDESDESPRGIFIGQHPMTLHLRGWLGTQSIRAMVLFEYLVCGRRCMPFGYQESDTVGAYIGYLTPEEVHYLLETLQHAPIPSQSEAEADYQTFRHQHHRDDQTFHQQRHKDDHPFRLIDEVLPIYANDFLQAIRNAADQNLGLICSHSP